MRVLVIIPVFNEANHLRKCLESFNNQTYKNILWILVNDSSTDNSQAIIEDFIINKTNFRLINLLCKSEHNPGTKVVRTFYKGLNSINWKNFEVIAKLDADIILPNNYFEIMVSELIKDPKIGIIGGLVYIEKDGKLIYENISNKNHVRGPIKTYRKECFESMNGLKETLGWDNLDILLAEMYGWKIKVIPSIKVIHLKPTGQVYKKTRAEKSGVYFYNIGLDKKLAFLSIAKVAWKEKSFKFFLVAYRTFLYLNKKKVKRKISPEEILFIRRKRWEQIMKKFR